MSDKRQSKLHSVIPLASIYNTSGGHGIQVCTLSGKLNALILQRTKSFQIKWILCTELLSDRQSAKHQTNNYAFIWTNNVVNSTTLRCGVLLLLEGPEYSSLPFISNSLHVKYFIKISFNHPSVLSIFLKYP